MLVHRSAFPWGATESSIRVFLIIFAKALSEGNSRAALESGLDVELSVRSKVADPGLD